jgi:type IV secretory pathway TrbD component
MGSSARERRKIHASLIRPVLFGGVERGVAVVLFAAGIGIPLFVGFHVLTLTIAFVFAVPMHALGVWMARRDPQMIAVYVRSISARDHYVPWGSRRVQAAAVHACIPEA